MSTIELTTQHQAGCPAQHIESYEAFPPDGRVVTVARCIDCGAHEVHNGAPSMVLPRLMKKGNIK